MGKRRAASQGEQASPSTRSTRQKAAAAADEPKAAPAAPEPPSSSHDPVQGVVRLSLMSEESRESLKQAYATSQPYLHCVFDNPFDPELLKGVRDEIINNIQATYKETDLFKVFQTGDLGNLSKLDPDAAAKLPSLMALKAALYSDAFRSFIRDVTGCGELSDQTDCSCNVYADGGHLLCHDDVIGTRRVSWIIYLTDPDDPWTEADGGALELYPCVEGKPHTPAVFPTVNHLPTFNTMAMFTVMPGKSFHAVQEVMTSAKPRMSISGWYHGPSAPQGAEQASLQQLQALKAGGDLAGAEQYVPFVEPAGGAPAEASGSLKGLSDTDLMVLLKYVNPVYLNEDAWPKMQAKFSEDGSIQLHNFLKRGIADRILQQLVDEDSKDGLGAGKVPAYEAGVRDGWEPVGPPHKQRFMRYAGEAAPSPSEVGSSCGALLRRVQEELFASGAFMRLLRCFTTLTMVGQRGEVRRFRPGLDYTVAHYGIMTKDPRLDVVLCFVDSRPPQEGAQQAKQAEKASSSAAKGKGKAEGKGKGKGKGKLAAVGKGRGKKKQEEEEPEEEEEEEEEEQAKEGGGEPVIDREAAWEAGEVGAFEAYLLADDEDGDAADTYRVKDQDESGVLNVSPAFNSLSLVLRDENLMKFVKYLSRLAPSSRWDIAMEYMPEDDSDDEEGKEEEKA